MGGRVLVVGGGISGLTSALCLARQGRAVTVVADCFAPRVTSVVAGALWEFPPAVCGHHRDQDSLTRSQDWCLTSYRHFTDLARRPETGVALRTATFYFQQPVADSPRHLGKMRDLRDKVCGFVHDPALIAANGVNPSLGLRDAYAP
jgi:D-amino-acid oxidase